MQKKLMAVAVAGALALPGVALAQSVTMSGFLKMGLGSIKIDEPNPAAPTATGGGGRAGLHDSEYRLVDNSSRIIFNMNEDLGSGLGALAQVDIRLSGDNGSIGATGNTYAGLQSKEAGRLTFGRHDLHYGKSPSDLPNKAGLLQLAAISLMDYMPNNSGTNVPIGRGTRTVNVTRWDSPNWGGFDVTLAYSANAAGPEADLQPRTTGTPPVLATPLSVRKGYATNIAAAFTGANFKVEYSNWNEKPDGSLADNKGDVINAWYRMGGLKFGMAYHMKEVKDAAGTVKTEANAWTIPVNFSTGAHDFHFHYTVAEQAKVNGNKWDQSGAKMMALSYVYNLSKRTTVGLNYGKIENEQNVGYQFFTDTGGDLSSGNAALKTGEDATIIAMSFRHAF